MNGKIKLEKGILNAVEVLDQILQSHKVEYFIIGAMARDILLKQVYEIDETGLVTEDIDFGVSMLNWDNYTDVVSSLISNDFTKDSKREHRFVFKNGFQ
ncbi:MAG: hypothetical protein KKF62_18550 [Bacteroidetes bacterium]|nr:hypothetical protein [Bacteroidota bacterium]MBU1114384.1 hypothetical protein [Bacteroidota bacterium]MBU1798321.1 hypothetical protein [Bacteroidota bacterium]